MTTTIDDEEVWYITIDGQTVQSVTADGTQVFTSATEIESFEDEDISEYALDTADFDVVTGAAVRGDYGLRLSSAVAGKWWIVTTDYALSNGNRYRSYTTLSGSSITHYGVVYGVQDETSMDGYYLQISPNDNYLRLIRIDDGAYTTLAELLENVYRFELHDSRLDWGSDGSLTMRVITGTDDRTLTATDSTYTSGGVGWIADLDADDSTDFDFDVVDER